MGHSYATADEYATWANNPGSTVSTVLLERATEIIDEVLIGAVYDVDDDGLPTDDAVAAALRDAVCAQAAHMLAVGDADGSGTAVGWDSIAIGSVQLSGKSTTGGVARTSSGAQVATGAIRGLRVAGLLRQGVISYG